MSKTPTRVYAVKQDGIVIALVRAPHPSTALRHAIRNSHTADVATQDELLEHVEAGMKVENATEQAQEQHDHIQHGPSGHAESHQVQAAREFQERRRNTREEADKYPDAREHLVGNR